MGKRETEVQRERKRIEMERSRDVRMSNREKGR